jgi:hypothetical protein
MTVRIRVDVPDDLLTEYERNAARYPALVEKAFRRQLVKIGGKVVKKLQTTPPPVKRPIRWKSERQRRAFFATDGFGGGIPSRRSGELQQGWKYTVDKLDRGGVLTVSNKVSYGRYVQGDDAQPFHLDTGWTQAAPVFAQARVDAEKQLEEIWITLADDFAGVR